MLAVTLPSPETMLTYASILEKPQYIVKDGRKFLLPTGEIIEAACEALRVCAQLKTHTEHCMNEKCPRGGVPVDIVVADR